jgi:hypothetical protein
MIAIAIGVGFLLVGAALAPRRKGRAAQEATFAMTRKLRLPRRAGLALCGAPLGRRGVQRDGERDGEMLTHRIDHLDAAGGVVDERHVTPESTRGSPTT